MFSTKETIEGDAAHIQSSVELALLREGAPQLFATVLELDSESTGVKIIVFWDLEADLVGDFPEFRAERGFLSHLWCVFATGKGRE